MRGLPRPARFSGSHTSTRRRLVVTAMLTGMALVIGVAFAAWLSNGTGSGSARALVAQPLTTLGASASASADLYPGGFGDLVLRIANPNSYPVVVSSVVGNGAITSDAAGCDPTNHDVTFTDQTGLALSVPASGNATHVLADAVAMGTDAANACQGAVFTVPVSMIGYSGADGGNGGSTDADADGFTVAGGDCDDTNAAVNPGATEIADNGVDDDCDGQTDEDTGQPISCDDGDPTTTDTLDETGTCSHTPNDALCDDGDPTTDDTYNAGTESCSHTPNGQTDADADGFTVAGGDCDDTNAAVNPAATEIADNGVDDDCDGVVDETS